MMDEFVVTRVFLSQLLLGRGVLCGRLCRLMLFGQDFSLLFDGYVIGSFVERFLDRPRFLESYPLLKL